MSKQLRILVSVVAAFALIAAAVGLAIARGGSGKEREHEAEGHGASHEMREALEKHSSLSKQRAIPLAFTSEKLAQASGDPEATGEIQNGPNQESYDQRAYPRKAIDVAQQQGSARAAARVADRAGTKAGRAVLADSVQSDAGSPASWQAVGPNGGLVAPEATYTGNAAHVSGRTTALATTGACTAGSCTLYAGQTWPGC